MRKFVCNAMAVFVAVALPAQSIASSLAIPIKVGLDASTQRFLDHYPIEILEQMILALEQAIPLVEASADHVIDRIDQTLQTTLDRVACIAPAAGDTAGQTAKKVKDIILGGDRQYGRTDLTDLEKFADIERGKIGGGTSIRLAEELQGNILGTANAAHCTFEKNAKVDLLVREISNENLARLDVWMQLDTLNCDQANPCYSAAYVETKSVVAAADPRDAAVAKVAARMANLPVPDTSFANGFDIKLTGWFSGFQKRKFQIASYEANVKEMISIQFDLAAQNAARVQHAKQMLDADAAALTNAKTGLAPLAAAFGGSYSAAVAQTFGAGQANAKSVRDQLAAIDVDAALSVAEAPELDTQASALKADVLKCTTEVGGFLRDYDVRHARLAADEAAEQKILLLQSLQRIQDRMPIPSRSSLLPATKVRNLPSRHVFEHVSGAFIGHPSRSSPPPGRGKTIDRVT